MSSDFVLEPADGWIELSSFNEALTGDRYHADRLDRLWDAVVRMNKQDAQHELKMLGYVKSHETVLDFKLIQVPDGRNGGWKYRAWVRL